MAELPAKTDGGKRPGQKLGSPQLPMTPKRKQVFLGELRRTGNFIAACRAASPHLKSQRAGYGSFKYWLAKDPEFRAACEQARKEAAAALVLEARRRGLEGWQEPVFQKGAQAVDAEGNPAVIRRYSDRMLELCLKATMPSIFGDKKRVEISGRVETGAVSFTSDDIACLSQEQAAHLMSILRTIRANRGEVDDMTDLESPIVDAEFEEVH